MKVMMCGVHLCLEPSMYTGTGFFIAGVLVKKSVRWQYEIGGKNVIVKEGRLFIYACNDRFTAYFQSLCQTWGGKWRIQNPTTTISAQCQRVDDR